VGVEAEATRTAVLHDPHPLWLDGLRRLLEREGVDVVAESTDERQALARARELRPDLLVTASLTATANVADAEALPPGVRTIVVADAADPDDVQAAFAAGAAAVVLKSAHPDDLATAVRQAFAPTVFTAPRTSRAFTPQRPAAFDRLTRREREILRLVAEGRSNDEVARLLWVSRQTVKFHLSSVYRKLEVSNRTEASRWAYAHGLLGEDAASVAA
jgi:two-component system, NarL family, response regulator LiaR